MLIFSRILMHGFQNCLEVMNCRFSWGFIHFFSPKLTDAPLLGATQLAGCPDCWDQSGPRGLNSAPSAQARGGAGGGKAEGWL